MRYLILAADYDGTLAHNGKVDDSTIEALQRLRESGRIPILVTGRQLDELLSIFPQPDIFERIVAENGALIYNPVERKVTALAGAPNQALVELLRRKGVPAAVGQVIIATNTPHEVAVLESVRELGLEEQVIFNKGAVMVLPAGINKASGLKRVLAELGFSQHGVIGIGDAENDSAFLELCECSVAVSNALPALKERVDLVVEGDHGAGVAELIDRLIATDLSELEVRLERHNVPFGFRGDGTQLRIKPYGSAILVAGTSGGGKSTLTTGFMERLRERNYQFCIVDPEGDYSDFDAVILGDKNHAPSPSEVVGVLMHPEQDVVINLTGMRLEERPAFFEALLPHFQELRAKTGRPHWLFIDESHHLLPETRDPSALIPRVMHGIWLVTVHPEHVARSVLQLVNVAVAIGNSPAETMESFASRLGKVPPHVPDTKLKPGEAIVWNLQTEEAPFWMRSIPGKMERQRHKRKYAEGELPPDRSFYFQGPEGKLNLRAQNLQLFMQIADGVDDGTWLHHLKNGDYSGWFQSGIKDDELAAAAAEVERSRGLSVDESRSRIRELIEARYTAPE